MTTPTAGKVELPEPTGDIRLPGAFALCCDGYSAAPKACHEACK